ncbi:hypothetical protein ES703_33048 [subsurface metagenome]
MSKPKKFRQVMFPPRFLYFKPQGIPMRQLEQVVLTVDEYEAIRLIDHEGMDQAGAAEKMNVSRPTSARIIESAHKKIAEALIQGKAIRIEGGRFVFVRNRLRCLNCGAIWETDLEQHEEDDPSARETACPSCNDRRVMDLGRQAGLRQPHA